MKKAGSQRVLVTVALLIVAGAAPGARARGVDQALTAFPDAAEVVLDYDTESGSIFAAVRYLSNNPGLSLSSSTDGVSWAWLHARGNTSSQTTVLDMVVAGDYVYLGYVLSQSEHLLHLLRFSIPAWDMDDAYHVSFDVSPYRITDVALESNADLSDDRLYCAFLQTDDDTVHNALFYWDYADVGSSFTEVSPPGNIAASGLDLHWNADTTAFTALVMSYVGTDDNVWIESLGVGGWLSPQVVAPYSGSDGNTGLSAHADTIIVTYEYDAGGGSYGCAVTEKPDSGGSWDTSWFPPGSGWDWNLRCDVSGRGGQGFAVVHHHLTAGDTEVVFHKRRVVREWHPAVAIQEHGASSSGSTTVAWLEPIDAFGIAYVGDPDGTAYVDIMRPDEIFNDGFETGTTAAWTQAVP